MYQHFIRNLPLFDSFVVADGEQMLSFGRKSGTADEPRVRRHRPDALLQRQIPQPDLAVAGARRQRGQVGGMLGHALHAVAVTRHAADERFGEHFVHFGGVEGALVLASAIEGM